MSFHHPPQSVQSADASSLQEQLDVLRTQYNDLKHTEKALRIENNSRKIENKTLRSINVEHRDPLQDDVKTLSAQNAELTASLNQSKTFRSAVSTYIIPLDPRERKDADILRKLDHLLQVSRLVLELLHIETGHDAQSHAELLTKLQKAIIKGQRDVEDLSAVYQAVKANLLRVDPPPNRMGVDHIIEVIDEFGHIVARAREMNPEGAYVDELDNETLVMELFDELSQMWADAREREAAEEAKAASQIEAIDELMRRMN